MCIFATWKPDSRAFLVSPSGDAIGRCRQFGVSVFFPSFLPCRPPASAVHCRADESRCSSCCTCVVAPHVRMCTRRRRWRTFDYNLLTFFLLRTDAHASKHGVKRRCWHLSIIAALVDTREMHNALLPNTQIWSCGFRGGCLLCVVR